MQILKHTLKIRVTDATKVLTQRKPPPRINRKKTFKNQTLL